MSTRRVSRKTFIQQLSKRLVHFTARSVSRDSFSCGPFHPVTRFKHSTNTYIRKKHYHIFERRYNMTDNREIQFWNKKKQDCQSVENRTLYLCSPQLTAKSTQQKLMNIVSEPIRLSANGSKSTNVSWKSIDQS